MIQNHPTDKFIPVDNLQLHYLEWGNENAQPMVLLHGIGDNAHIWDHFARNAAHHLRIIALDQRGHGLSDWAVPPAYRCEDYLNDLDKVIQALRLTGIILMGHSMGALHATRYASLRPENVSALIHADIEACPPKWNKKYLLNLYEELPAFYETVDQYVSELRENSPYAEENLLYDIASHALVQGEDGRFRCRFDRETLSHFDNYDLRPCLRDIQCPSLVIRGKESRVMTEPIAREMSHAIPRCTFVEIQKAAHPVLTDNPTEFLRIVSNFLGEPVIRN